MGKLLQSLFPGSGPELVVFDLDGTLVDSVPDLAIAVDNMLRDVGRVPAGEEKVRCWVGNGAEMLVKRALTDGREALTTKLPAALFVQGLTAFKRHYEQVNGLNSVLYPKVIKTLARIQDAGVPMAIVTNKPKVFTVPLLSGLGIDGFFQQVVGGECLPRKKPAPEPLLHVAAQLAVAPGRSLMVGDSRNDVGAARAAGFRIVGLSYSYNHGEPIARSNPDFVIDSLPELLD